MKSDTGGLGDLVRASPPSRGAWIEIVQSTSPTYLTLSSPPSRGAWIEIVVYQLLKEAFRSPPSRGAWIEMVRGIRALGRLSYVAPLAGGVD